MPGGTNGTDRTPQRASNAAPADLPSGLTGGMSESAQPRMQLNGGLVLLQADALPSGNGNASQSADQASASAEGNRPETGEGAVGSSGAGRDPIGFMRVWVLRGGVNSDFSQKGGN